MIKVLLSALSLSHQSACKPINLLEFNIKTWCTFITTNKQRQLIPMNFGGHGKSSVKTTPVQALSNFATISLRLLSSLAALLGKIVQKAIENIVLQLG